MTSSSGSEYERAETEAATWLVLLADEPDGSRSRAALRGVANGEPAARRTVGAHDARLRTGREGRARGFCRCVDSRAVHASGRLFETTGAGVRSHCCRRRLPAAARRDPPCCCGSRPIISRRRPELRSLTLEDGTQVRLGPESALGVDFTAGERRVRLLKGEAFFDVVPNAARPFRVAAD